MADHVVECTLGTHDVAIPISTTGEEGEVLFRFILLSAVDAGMSDAWRRMERLYHLEGGCNCAVVFLLQGESEDHGMASYMTLQIRFTNPSGPREIAQGLT